MFAVTDSDHHSVFMTSYAGTHSGAGVAREAVIGWWRDREEGDTPTGALALASQNTSVEASSTSKWH